MCLRIARGKVLLRRERLDLTELTRATADDHRATIEQAGLNFTLELPDSPAWVQGDPTRLAQVIGNLLHNASKFTDPGGSISLSLRCQGDNAVVTVADTGIGMDAVLLAHAFEAFNQAEQTLDRSRGGLGLGLALSKGLIDLHGGHINAASEGDGKGTALRLSLPLAIAPAAVAPGGTADKPAASWCILVIEDNVDAAKTLGSLLRLFKHQAMVTYFGVQGLQVARDFHPDVILCDIGLPGGMDGFDVARAICADDKLRSAYLIAITGYAQEEDVQQAHAAGFNLHMTKPVDPNRLEKFLASLNLPQDAANYEVRPVPNPQPVCAGRRVAGLD